ncbi:MAG: tetratricopeptide repeat protein, partial [Vicinamibacterales bacterium]
MASATHQLTHGDLADALALTNQGIELTRAQPASVQFWQLRLLRGEILLLQRKPDDVVPLLKESLPDSPAFARLRAKQKCLEGQLHVISGNLSQALETLDAAERLAQAAGDTNVVFSARGLRGQVLLRLERWAEGDSTLARLVADAEQAGDGYHLAVALINLGIGRRVRDRFDEALPYFERAAALTRVTTRIRAVALTNLGICYTRLGDYDRAIAVQRQAVDAHEASAPVFFAQALGELGTTYYLKGDTSMAVSHLSRALHVAVDSTSNANPGLWAAHLALVHIELRDWDRAAEFSGRSRALTRPEDAERLVYNTLLDADIAAGRGERGRAIQLYQKALASAGT